ncbi:ABC transporter substrate-binding protein [Actinophytocola gossypii]|uniref:ABC transporter substrate-binding protein n=1 Tax=Actinophytocola gossypii TaxID=2812003 RepID=A0ABT2J768_9PSEU|nr:ABC transporter substrate-binding protein [Actinophytocola gossypii]MCT2583541.1 ABC transporter substrate-binding protein [Actinophytocola gossypii]
MRKTTLAALAAVTALWLSGCEAAPSESAADFGTENPTGEPIVLGVMAPTTGATAYPDTAYGAQGAEYYVNKVLGGIDGRPIKLDICGGDGSPEHAINCANSYVSKKVPAVIDAYEPALQGALPILGAAGIPLIGTLAGTGSADRVEYGAAFYYTGPTEVSALGSLTMLDSIGVKKAALAVTDAPASHTYVDEIIRPIAGELGIDVSIQYPPGNGANFSVLAATQLAEDPDSTGVIALPEDSCTELYKAIRQQGFTDTFFAGSCSKFINVLGGEAEGAATQPRLWVHAARDHAPDEVRQQLDDFQKSMDAIGHGDQLSTRAIYAFAGVVNTAKAIGTISGDVTAASVTDAMKGLKDFPTFAGPNVTCDGKVWPGMPTACSKQAIFFEVQSDGTLKSVEEQGYVDLDLSLIPDTAS